MTHSGYRLVRGRLQRVGAVEACIFCGMPNLPGTLTWAHIHERDLALAPGSDRRRVFRLCWQHHHGGYDQGYLTTPELLGAEEAWIADPANRPRPHPRDIALMRRVAAGEVEQNSQWVPGDSAARSERAGEARATDIPDDVLSGDDRPQSGVTDRVTFRG